MDLPVRYGMGGVQTTLGIPFAVPLGSGLTDGGLTKPAETDNRHAALTRI